MVISDESYQAGEWQRVTPCRAEDVSAQLAVLLLGDGRMMFHVTLIILAPWVAGSMADLVNE